MDHALGSYEWLLRIAEFMSVRRVCSGNSIGAEWAQDRYLCRFKVIACLVIHILPPVPMPRSLLVCPGEFRCMWIPLVTYPLLDSPQLVCGGSFPECMACRCSIHHANDDAGT